MEYIVSYRIVSREKPSYRIDIVSNRKKAYRYWLIETMPNLGVVKWGQDENCDCEELKNLFWKVFQVVAYCLPQFQVLRWHSRDGVDNHLIQDTMIHSLEIFLQAGWCLQTKTHFGLY